MQKKPGVRLPALVPNRQGFLAARAVGVREIAVFTAASETFNKKNINATMRRSWRASRGVAARLGRALPSRYVQAVARIH